MTPPLMESGYRYPDFAIVSNVRCGSTWLATALANTHSGLTVDWEVKLEGYSRSSVHFPVGTSDLPERLDALARSIADTSLRDFPIIGTKITLDVSVEPFHTLNVPGRWRLLQEFRSEASSMRFVHLTRGLCDQSQSPGGHSTRSLDSEEASSLVVGSRLLKNVIHESGDAEATLSPIAHQCDPQKVFHKFMNDLCVASALSEGQRYLRVQYESLRDDFPSILTFLGVPANRSLDEVSLTAKNPRLSPATSCELGLALTRLRDYLLAAIDATSIDDDTRRVLIEGAGALFESERVRVVKAASSTSDVTGRDLLHEIRRRAQWKAGFRRGRQQ